MHIMPLVWQPHRTHLLVLFQLNGLMSQCCSCTQWVMAWGLWDTSGDWLFEINKIYFDGMCVFSATTSTWSAAHSLLVISRPPDSKFLAQQPLHLTMAPPYSNLEHACCGCGPKICYGVGVDQKKSCGQMRTTGSNQGGAPGVAGKPTQAW